MVSMILLTPPKSISHQVWQSGGIDCLLSLYQTGNLPNLASVTTTTAFHFSICFLKSKLPTLQSRVTAVEYNRIERIEDFSSSGSSSYKDQQVQLPDLSGLIKN